MTPAARRAQARSEDGTTLVELLAAIVLSSALIGSIAGALTVGWRTTGATTERLAGSHTVELVDTYFPADVASAAPNGITTGAAAPTGCEGPSIGTNLVVLPRAAAPGGPAAVTSYRFDQAAGTIARTTCDAGSAATTRTVATRVEAAVATASTGADGRTKVTLAVTLEAPISLAFEVTGRSRTPTPPAPLPEGPPGTTAPPLPCKVDSALIGPRDPLALASGTTLEADVTVSVTVSGSCVGPLSVTFVPGASGPAVTEPLTPAGSTHVVTLGRSAYAWTAGTKTFTVGTADGAAVLNPTRTLTVAAACRLVTATPTPGSATLAAGTTLTTDIVVDVTVDGLCTSPLTLSFEPGAPGTAATVALTPAGGGFRAVLGRASHPWTVGSKVATITQAGGAPVATPTFSFTVAPATPCTVTSMTLTPGSVGRASNGRLASPVAVSATTTGTCVDLSISYVPEVAAVTQALQANGATWTATIPNGGGAPKWTAGGHVVTLSGANGATATLAVT